MMTWRLSVICDPSLQVYIGITGGIICYGGLSGYVCFLSRARVKIEPQELVDYEKKVFILVLSKWI